MNHHNPWLTPDWPVPPNVHAATTLRTGGFSAGGYSSLNPAGHVGDNPAMVKQNRALIKSMLALPSEPIWLTQTHSNIVVEATLNTSTIEADASFTHQSGVVCTVLTADCLPLLVAAENGSEIAAIHAGWRGLLNGIITNTINALTARNLLVWLGPAIGPQQFEVGSEVLAAFTSKSTDYANAFIRQDNGKYLANIYQLARINLNHLGVDKIYGGNFCTMTDSTRFYSYRREPITGRMATLIWRD